MAGQIMVGLTGGSISQARVHLVQHLIFDFVVAFLCVANTEADLMLLSVVDNAIERSIA